ncbi:MAG: ATP-binding protein [Tildeniella nuda ZEHNDER 1965/U140]|jgi:tetratricopeptide (TPR) repeat protein|nr:ATP-binding protein [Tildeniella nuda ZEHNDER 1965/U140]
MTPEEALGVADQVLYVHAGKRLTDIQRLILLESLAGKGYEEMQGYATQHIKNEGKELWAALSGALDEKVSKTNFRGALEKRLRSTQIVPKPPSLSAYDAKTWAGRDALIGDLLNQLHGQTRLLCLTGISGIGKTALAECLAVQFQNPDVSFHRVSFDIVGQSQDFTAGAAEILAELGDKDLDPKELNDPKRLSDRLLRKLQMHQYWLQLDALERLLDPEHPTEFTDSHWLGFFQRCLSSSDFPSRLVLTAQAIPSEFARFEDDYPHAWSEQTLRGLSDTEQLELFGKYGVADDSTNDALLSRIGQTYEGHPLVLRVIGGEIRKDFGGNVVQYWERYGSEFEQVARELQSQRVNPALYNQTLQKRVRQRVEISFKRLPEDALNLLCRSAVYRRPVVESFWLVMLEDRTPFQQQEAYRVLSDRTLVEQEGTLQEQLLIRQHNLIRDVAYDLLQKNSEVWKSAQQRAAEMWLTAYQPAPDGPNLEKVRGYLEAFHHYYEVKDWQKAIQTASTSLSFSTEQDLSWHIRQWGYYREYFDLQNNLLTIVHKMDNRQGEGIILSNLGVAHLTLGNYQQAIDYHQKQLAIAREIRHQDEECSALLNLGNSYLSLNGSRQAIDCYEQCLTIARDISHLKWEASALGSLGHAHSHLQNHQQAIDYHQQSLVVFRKIQDHWGESVALINIGHTYVLLGDPQQAIHYQQLVLPIAHKFGYREMEGKVLLNLVLSYSLLGDYQQTIECSQQSLIIFRETGNHHQECEALVILGIAYKVLNDYQQSMDTYQQCLTMARKIEDKPTEGKVLGVLGQGYSDLGDYQQAINFYQQALEVVHELGDQAAEGEMLMGWAHPLIKTEKYSEALEKLQSSLEIFTEIGATSNQAEALKQLAQLYQVLGQVDCALECCEQAFVIASELGIPLAEECRKLKEELEKVQNK